jgi:outer membrane protein TolC
MKLTFTISSLFLLISFSFIGQEELSAKGAVLKALENNFQMKIAEKQVEIADKNNKWSEAGLFPTVDLTASVNNTVIDNTNNPFTFTPGLIYNRSLSPGISANWNIFSGMGVKITKDRLEQLEEQSNGNANTILENTSYDVLSAYYNCLMQKSQLENLREIFSTTKLQVLYEEKRTSLGQANKLALAQIQNQFYSDSINIIQQQVVYDNALRNLMLLMNVPAEDIEQNRFPVLTDSLTIQLEPIDQESIVEQATTNNQNLKNQMINEKLQQTNTQMQRSFLYPTLNLQLGASPNFGNVRSLSDDNLKAETQQINYFANLNLRYSLFNNWKNKRAVEVAKIQEEIASMNTQELKKQLITTTVNLTNQFTVRNKLVDVAAINVNYAQEAFKLGQKRFKLGGLNSIELAQLRNAYLNAKLNYTNLLFQRIQTYLEIYRTSGNLLLTYED